MEFVRRRLMFESALEMIEADVRAAGVGRELSLSIDERFSIVPCKEGTLYLAGRKLDAGNHADAVIELADIVQYEVIDVLMTPWPWCSRHNSMANPQVKDDIPVWWCESGEHTLYRIGGIVLQSLFRVISWYLYSA
jgi:hypothetical protein